MIPKAPRLPVIEGRVLFAITGRFLNMAFDPCHFKEKSINQITNMLPGAVFHHPHAIFALGALSYWLLAYCLVD